MNKGEFVHRLSARTGFTTAFTRDFVDDVLDELRTAVAEGESVAFERFGSFEPKQRAPRKGRNPRENVAVEVPAKTIPVFRPSQTFKDLVNEKNGRTDSDG